MKFSKVSIKLISISKVKHGEGVCENITVLKGKVQQLDDVHLVVASAALAAIFTLADLLFAPC